MNSKIKAFVIILSFIAIVCVSFAITLRILHSNKYDFSATSTNGNITLQDLNGKYKIIYFGYTFCPDICPLTLGILKEALDEIENNDFLVVFISLDPERDTPQILQEYAEFFYPNSLGLWLESNELQRVAKNYGIKYENIMLRDSAIDYSVAHSSALFLIDENGKFVGKITNLTKEEIQDAIKKTIK